MRTSSPGYSRASRVCPSRPGWLAALLLATIATSGCSVVSAPYGAVTGPVGFFRDHAAYNDASESLVLGWRNHVWSKKAWYQQRHLYNSHPYVKDFGKGFQAGYSDIAGGGSGCVPVLPPREYWSWRYQSPEGQGKTGAWFEGYPLGAAAAEKDGIANWGHIQTGYTADSKSIRGRANYVRIRDELLKKEMRGEAEEVAAPAETVPPRTIPLREPDDLPPPRKVEPKPAKPEPKAEPKDQTGALEALPPILPDPAAAQRLREEARKLPAETPAPRPSALERLPAVEPEPFPIQQVRAELTRLPHPSAVALDKETVAVAEKTPVTPSEHSSGGDEWAGNPFDQARQLVTEAQSIVAPPPVAAPSETTPVKVERPIASFKRGVALHAVSELEAPPKITSWDAPESAAAESRPAMPRMRGLRARAEAPEAPLPPTAVPEGVRVARESLREERAARATLTGPILERRGAGEANLSDSP